MDLTKIPYEQSPNFSSRHGSKITHIVIHVTEGEYPGCKNWLKNPKSQVSAHYVISRKGEIVHLVQNSYKAWHCMNANPFTIGIEHEGFSYGHLDVTKEQWKTSLDLSAALCKAYGIPIEHVIGHNDVFLKQYGNSHGDPAYYINMDKYRLDLKKVKV